MIKLLIDGTRVYPDKDQTIVFKDYNTLCIDAEGQGAYTYDIDLDLNVKANATMYNWLSKVNLGNVPTGRTAEMYVDEVLIFKGTETVLSIVGMKAKIQILCGASEMNFQGNEKKIRSLDLGTIPDHDLTFKLSTLNLPLQQTKMVYAPVMVKYDEYPYDEDGLVKFANFIDKDSVWGSVAFHSNTNFIPQPSLIDIIEKVITAMGWTIEHNELWQMEYAKDLYVVHGYTSRKYKELIPNWTINDFISEIEKFFNIVIVCNDKTKKVSICNLNNYYANLQTSHTIQYNELVDIRTSLERNFDSDNKNRTYDKVLFELPESNFYRRANVSDEIKEKCEVLEFNKFSDFNIATYKSSEYYNKPYYFHEKKYDTYWVLVKSWPTSSTTYHFERINQFKTFIVESRKDDESVTETNLKIVPAEVFCLDIHPKDSDGVFYLMGAGVPYARNSDVESSEEDDEKGLNDWIKEGLGEEKVPSNLFVAQYLGCQEVLWSHDTSSQDLQTKYETAFHPSTCVTRFLSGVLHAGGATRYAQVLDMMYHSMYRKEAKLMDLDKRCKDVYKIDANLKPKENLIVTYVSCERLDVKQFYVIEGKKYICVSNEYTIEKGELSKFVKGTFIPFVENEEAKEEREDLSDATLSIFGDSEISEAGDYEYSIYVDPESAADKIESIDISVVEL